LDGAVNLGHSDRRAAGDWIRRGLEKAEFSFRLQGAVLFGSCTKGHAGEESDLDLLVVGIGIAPQRQRRSREILQIARIFPGAPLDILLMTPEEVGSNFRNHHPLFLNIAEDGIILLDTGGSLAAALEETRRYIGDRGIERLQDGWRYPAARGAAT